MAKTETIERDDKRNALDAFAASPNNGNGAPPMVPSVKPLAAPQDRVFGAQQVAVYRDEARILQKLAALGAAAGDAWYYRYPVKNRKTGTTDWIEGPSIKLANDVARIYGNCDVDTRVIDLGDTWLIYARFTDFETGYSLTRPFQQRKSQGSMKTDNDRALDIAFQIGVSKAMRNVVVNGLQTFADHAFDSAYNSLVDKIGKDLDKWRVRTVEGISKIPMELARVERVMGRAAKDWTAPDVAKVIAMMKAIADGMATADETFPPLDAKTDEPAGDEHEAETKDLNEFAGKKDGGDGAASNASPQPTGTQQQQEAAGQAAPTRETGNASEQGAAEASSGNGSKEVQPTTSVQYTAYANAWLGKATNADEIEKRWKDEKKLRSACHITADAFDELESTKKARVAELKKG